MAVNVLTTLLTVLGFFRCCADKASTIWLFTDSLCEGEPQVVLKFKGEACEQVTVGPTTYYGRGDCHTLKQGSFRLCFDNECQECQDFQVRRERQCGGALGLGLSSAEWACAHPASTFLAQNQSGFVITDASSVGIHTTATARTKQLGDIFDDACRLAGGRPNLGFCSYQFLGLGFITGVLGCVLCSFCCVCGCGARQPVRAVNVRLPQPPSEEVRSH